jgi:hypothetical protein
VRKVTITANGLPVFKSLVTFDSTVSPESIKDKLLKKKLGVGTIFDVNNVTATKHSILDSLSY